MRLLDLIFGETVDLPPRISEQRLGESRTQVLQRMAEERKRQELEQRAKGAESRSPNRRSDSSIRYSLRCCPPSNQTVGGASRLSGVRCKTVLTPPSSSDARADEALLRDFVAPHPRDNGRRTPNLHAPVLRFAARLLHGKMNNLEKAYQVAYRALEECAPLPNTEALRLYDKLLSFCHQGQSRGRGRSHILTSRVQEFEHTAGKCPEGCGKCQFCGKVLWSACLANHELFCKSNPIRQNYRKMLRQKHELEAQRLGDKSKASCRSGTYIVQDGLVVFLNEGYDTRDGRIARSEANSGDYWRGFGVGRPDNGRFGSISGEDFSGRVFW